MPQIFNNNSKPIQQLGRTKSTLYLNLHQRRMELIKSSSNFPPKKKHQKQENRCFQKDEIFPNFMDKNLQKFKVTQQTLKIHNHRPNNIQRALELQKQILYKKEKLLILQKQLLCLKISRQSIQKDEQMQIEEIQGNISIIQTFCQQSIKKKQNFTKNLIQIQTINEELKFIKSKQIRERTLAKNNLQLLALEKLSINKQIQQLKQKIKIKLLRKTKIFQFNSKIQKLKSIKQDGQQYLAKIMKMNEQKLIKAKSIIQKGIKKQLMYYKQQHVDYMNQTVKYIQMVLNRLRELNCQHAEYMEIRNSLKMLSQNNTGQTEGTKLQKIILVQHQTFFNQQLVKLNLPPQFMTSNTNNPQLKQNLQQNQVQQQNTQLSKNLQNKEAAILKLIRQSHKLSQQIKECQQRKKLPKQQFNK